MRVATVVRKACEVAQSTPAVMKASRRSARVLARFAAEELDGLGDRPGAGRKPRTSQARRHAAAAASGAFLAPPGGMLQE
jgi:hypothetical protein